MDSRSPAGGPAEETILDSLVEHVVRHDREMRIIWANRAACESVGLSRQEVIGRHCYELWACREDPCPDCPVTAAMRDGERHRIERNTPDGRAWIITGSPVRDEEGAIIGGVETTLEITDRKRAEETLQASENRQRFVVAHMPVLMSAVDADGNIVEWNRECERVTGYTAEEIVGNPRAMELLYPDADYRRQLMAEWKRRGSEFRDWEHRLRCKNGSERIIALSSIAERPSAADWLSWSIGVDITERKRAEEASRESRALLESTIESLPFDFFALDPQGRYIMQNSFCRQRWGDSIGQRPEDLDIGEEIRSLWMANNRRAMAGETIDEEVAFSFGGRSGFYRNIITPIRDEGEIRGILGVNLDVTERKQIEEQRLAHLRFLESLERIDREVRRATDLEEMMSAVLEAARSVFDCDRAWLLYPCDPEALSWRVPMERTTPPYPGAMAQDVEVPMDEGVARVMRLVLQNEGPVKFGPGSEHPLPEAAAQRFHYQSQIGMAVYPQTGGPWMFGLHQCSSPRQWSDEEERLFQEIGRRIGDSLSTLLMLRDLRESRRALATLMDNLPGMAYRCLNDEQWTMRFVSDGCVELTGYQSEDLIENAVVAYTDLIHPDDRRLVREEIDEALEGRDLFQIIYRIRTARGRLRWVWEQGRGVFDNDGRLEALEGFIADITERQEAEAALVASEQNYRAIFDAANDAFFIHDAQTGKILDVNQKMCDLFGYSRAEARELTIGELSRGTPPYSTEDAVRWVRKAAEEGQQVFEWIARAKSGRTFWAEVNLKSAMIGGERHVLAVVRDISERKRAEEALRKSEEQLRFMVGQMPAVVWTIDTDLRFTSSQGGGLHELSLFPDQVIGQDLLAYFRTDDPQFPPIVAHRRALAGESVEYEMTWTGRTFATHVEPLRDAAGRIIGCVGVALDITERKAAEEEVRRRAEAERLLLSELDHRVRNNLSSLIALIDLMGASSTNVSEFAEAIRGRARTMATVHSALSRSHWEAVRLRALLDALVPPGVKGILRITGSDLRITAAQAQALGMVINELMTNSFKHGALGAAGGAVDVSWEEAPADAHGISLTLRWEESGGPAIENSPEAGFGTGLINGLVNSELRGRAHFDYPRRGARHLFRINLDEPQTPRTPAETDPATSPESG